LRLADDVYCLTLPPQIIDNPATPAKRNRLIDPVRGLLTVALPVGWICHITPADRLEQDRPGGCFI